MKRLASRIAAACAVVGLAVVACSSSRDQTCAADCSCTPTLCADAHDGDARWTCDVTQEPPTCAATPRTCATAADCCPSQLCSDTCFDNFTPCENASMCPAAGQVCQTIGIRPAGMGCTFARCGADGSCAAAGAVCFNGSCVGEAPCQGGCADVGGAAQVCVTETNLCSPAPHDSGGTCQRACPIGEMRVLHQPEDTFDVCDLAAETCDCLALP